ncbi:MAG: hypothetical protein Q7K39_02980 [Candidatus Magasanikbacteria bacterium]|nr:hypothetical protein [Candidatus Magasanikbacteria bacterium]
MRGKFNNFNKFIGGLKLSKLLLLVVLILSATTASAQELQSGDFNDSNPILTIQGGYSSSSNFQVYSGSGQAIIGESTSSAFIARLGWFYFPVVTAPILSAAAGNAQVSLAWTAAIGSLGFNVAAYEVGQGLNANGSFSYSNVGNILSSLQSSLTNGTAYYFVVRALDAFGQSVVSSSIVAATPVSAVTPVVAAASGGGPGPLLVTTLTFASLNLTGETVPNSQVTILRDGVLFSEFKSDFEGKFFGNFTDLAPGQSIFTIFSTDQSGRRSAPTSLLLNLAAGQTINTGLLILAPSISAGEAEVKRGEEADISGQTAPLAEVTILVEPGKFLNKTKSGADGNYNFKLDTKIFKKGPITIRTRVEKKGQVSEWSRPINIIIGDKTAPRVPAAECPLQADFNTDCQVNIIDFSILLYWFNRQSVPAEIDLNADGIIDLVDFSIFIYYWTG